MNILVYNIAAEYAGALTILKNFYMEALNYLEKDINWYFVVSTNQLVEAENIKIIQVPWIKKSWIHRFVYDKFCAHKLVKEYNIDIIFNMQNMTVSKAKVRQVVYFHQSLQFSPVRYSFFKKEECSLAIRQKIICNLYKQSLKRADRIIVQTEWMKESTASWLKYSKEKIIVRHPNIPIPQNLSNKDYKMNKSLFFYPAGDAMHKNHYLIIQACKILKEKGINSYKVVFTMESDTSEYSRKLKEEVEREKLNVDFVGIIPQEEVYGYYKNSIMLFPSYLETFGLPLLEAAMSGTVIFAANRPYAQEILGDYPNAYFFDYKDVGALVRLMEKMITGEIEHKTYEKNVFVQDNALIPCLFSEK